MKVLVVGYGSIGKRHVKNLLLIKNIEIIICSKQEISNFSPQIKIKKHISECIKEKPNIAIICNESSYHVKTALRLAKYGIDLFIEKPLGISQTDTNELIKVIKKNKIISQMGCQLRFHKCIKEMKKAILKNQIGKIISARVECGSYLPDWHPHEDYKKSYAAINNLGGGVVFTNIHELDYLYWFFGDVNEVFSYVQNSKLLKISADDFAVGLLKFKNNIIVEIHLDYLQKDENRSCKIIGEKGIILWESKTNLVKLYDNKKRKWTDLYKLNNYDRNKMFEEEIKYFLSCVKNRKKSFNPVEKDGIITTKIGIAMMNSSKKGRVVKI